MELGEVTQLAHRENELWRSGAGAPPVAPAAGSGAYAPLGDSPREAGDVEPSINYIDATAVGTVLLMRFRWPLDDRNRDLLLPIDFRDYPHGVEGASTWLLEYVRHYLHHDRSWYPRDVMPMSDRVAVVRPSRSPGHPEHHE